MTVAVTHVAWKPCWRIIPSRFPPIALFERVTEPDDLEAIFELESLTNPRLRDEVGEISLVPPEERISGPGTSIIMAAFTYLNPEGSWFSDGSYGVFYPANDLDIAIAETRHHRERFMRATKQEHMELDMRVYVTDLDGELHDLRGQKTLQPPQRKKGRRQSPSRRTPGSLAAWRSKVSNSLAPERRAAAAIIRSAKPNPSLR